MRVLPVGPRTLESTPLLGFSSSAARASVAIFEIWGFTAPARRALPRFGSTLASSRRAVRAAMANRNAQQTNMQSSNSPQPPKLRTDCSAAEQAPADKDSPAPPPPPPQQQQQQSQSQSPAAEPAEGAAEETAEGPVEMTLNLMSFRKPGEKTFTQRCRLFVGNLPVDISEEEFKNMFAKYGKCNEVFINRDRGFGFIRLVRGGRCTAPRLVLCQRPSARKWLCVT